jgi:hypothetical protein
VDIGFRKNIFYKFFVANISFDENASLIIDVIGNCAKITGISESV